MACSVFRSAELHFIHLDGSEKPPVGTACGNALGESDVSIFDSSVGGHGFPTKIEDFGLDPSRLHEGVLDMETWIEQVVRFAEENGRQGYSDNDIRGDAFEHLVECVIKHFGGIDDIDCVGIEAMRENADGIDLIGRTRDGFSHAHQCKFRSNTENALSPGADELDKFISACFTNDIGRATIWTTARGIHPRTQARFGNKVHAFGYDDICDIVDGEDGRDDFWMCYARSLDPNARLERNIGRLNDTDDAFATRDFQEDALGVFKKEVIEKGDVKGRYVYPTGAGKTIIECMILNYQMKRLYEPGVHVVVAPKIELVNQLMRDYRVNIGDDYRSIGFHSGANVHFRGNRELGRTQRNTTKVSRILDAIGTARDKGQHLVVFSTYDSLWKLAQKKHGISFETLIADESQYCVSENYFEQVRRISSKVKLFFTATEKYGVGDTSDDRRSNDNEKVFGPILGEETYDNLIARGILVKPLLHLLQANRENKSRDSIVDESIYIANKQRKMASEKMHSKVLFACERTDSIKVIVDEHMGEIRNSVNEDHKVFTIISDHRYKSMINGKPVEERADFLKQLASHNGNAMIFHYDILSEGIDVDGISGVAVLRNMNQIKLLQTIGRSMRPLRHEMDTPIEKRVKRHSYVSVPVIDGDVKNSEILRSVIKGMVVGGLEPNMFDNSPADDGGPPPDPPNPPIPPIPPIPPDPSPSFFDLLQTKLKDVEHVIEDVGREVEKEKAREAEKHERRMEEILYHIDTDVKEGILNGMF